MKYGIKITRHKLSRDCSFRQCLIGRISVNLVNALKNPVGIASKLLNVPPPQ